MKKTLCSLGLCMLIAAQAGAQSKNMSGGDEPRPIRKGQNSLYIYYGVSLSKSIYRAAAAASAVDLKFSGIGPVGAVFEHMVSDVVGLGGEVGYSSLKMTYTESSEYLNGKTIVPYEYTAEWKFSTLRVMFRSNFHFIKNENFDMYGLASLGYRSTSFSYSDNDPYYNNTNKVTFSSPIPVGLKLGLGFRYYFNESVGINAEMALGTPILSAGLNFKF